MKYVHIDTDMGGTVTDILLLDKASGTLAIEKVSSTPHDPAEAIVGGTALILRQHSTAVEDVDDFAHGSTIVTSTLLQQKGASAGLITTAGFRDLLEIGRQARFRTRHGSAPGRRLGMRVCVAHRRWRRG